MIEIAMLAQPKYVENSMFYKVKITLNPHTLGNKSEIIYFKTEFAFRR